MSRDHHEEGRRFAAWLGAQTQETRREVLHAQLEDSRRERAEFTAAFAAGYCYICGGRLDSFEERRPCLHWLLRPIGFRKKHFEHVTAEYGVFQIQSYLRWVASEDGLARHVPEIGGGAGGDRVEPSV